MVVLKCKLGPDTRRIRLDTLTFQQLTNEILPTMFSEDISNYHITYVDPEGDTIFLTSQEELKESLLLFPDALVLNLSVREGPVTKDDQADEDYVDEAPKKTQRKRKTNGKTKEEGNAEPKKQKSNGAWRANSISVRAMIVEALGVFQEGGTIHDILEYMHENYPQEVKNLKDVQSAVQSQLSARKEFAKLGKTDKNLTIWSLTAQKGMKKVQKPHKTHKLRSTRSRSSEAEEEDAFDAPEQSVVVQNVEPEPAPTNSLTGEELVVKALKTLGGKGTISDVREWLISHCPEQWSLSYKLNQILSTVDLFQEDTTLPDGAKVWKLVEKKPEVPAKAAAAESVLLPDSQTEREISALLVDMKQ